MMERYFVEMLAAYSGWVLPERSSDLASQALSFGPRGPFFGQDRNMMTGVKEGPSCGQAYDAASDYEKMVGGLVWMSQPRGTRTDVLM